ncbi:MAG: hypothetical protein LR011_02475, partial [Verrucomicrobia bacterium]|nr:hypothetical protein [Verrucomicrobiota bacterium]
MNTDRCKRLALSATMILAGISPWNIQAQDTLDSLRVYTAIEVEYETEKGKIYQLQGSSDLNEWAVIGDPVYGNGNKVTLYFSSRKGVELDYAMYRLSVNQPVDSGYAPWSVAGMALLLDDEPGDDILQFLDESNGLEEDDSDDRFTYEISKLNENQLTIKATRNEPGSGSQTKIDIYTLTFSSPDKGMWSREEIRKGKVKDRDQGVFTLVSLDEAAKWTPPNPGSASAVSVPTSLSTLSYLFNTGESPDLLEFVNATQGVEHEDSFSDDDDDDDDNPGKSFTYTYTTGPANTATLNVSFNGNRRDEYMMTFTAGSSGRFVRNEYRGGNLKDVDRGSFSLLGETTGSSPMQEVDDKGGDRTDDSSDDSSDD